MPEDYSPERVRFRLRPLNNVNPASLLTAVREIDGVTFAELLADDSVRVYTHRPEWFVQDVDRITRILASRKRRQTHLKMAKVSG